MADSPGLNQDEINPDEMISCDLYEGMVRLEADAAIVATSEWLNLVVMVQSQEASRVEIIPHHPRASSLFHCWKCESAVGTKSRPWNEFSACTCSDYLPRVVDLLALLGSSLDGNTIGNAPREVTNIYNGGRAEYATMGGCAPWSLCS